MQIGPYQSSNNLILAPMARVSDRPSGPLRREFAHAEFETIREVKQKVNIPIIENGENDSPKSEKLVPQFSGSNAIMMCRSTLDQPGVFREIQNNLTDNQVLKKRNTKQIEHVLNTHLERVYEFLGELTGVRIARKQFTRYLRKNPAGSAKPLKQVNETLVGSNPLLFGDLCE